MAKTKKSDNLEYCRGIRVMDVAVYVFALLAFGVYPLIYDDHYFNITITKYHFFLYAAGIYLALALIGYVVEAKSEEFIISMILCSSRIPGRNGFFDRSFMHLHS